MHKKAYFCGKSTDRMNTTTTSTPITCFTLEELIDMSGDKSRKGILRECVIAQSDSHMTAFRFPCRIDAFIIGVGCEGETSVTINLRQYTLRKDTLFVVSPQHIVQVQSDDRFKAHVMVISSEFLQRINIDMKLIMPLFMQFTTDSCLELPPTDSETMRSFMTLVERETRGAENRFVHHIISELLAATLYKLSAMLHQHFDQLPRKQSSTNSRSEEYMQRFSQLLNEHYKQERSVTFYAQKLCITPKYLTTLIKRISKRSVSEWIDSYVIMEAKTLIKYSNMSIQEISYYLNFPNQSFFGSYFKRHTGLSPSQYKAMV